jgi:hypothetical protein
LAIAFAPDVPIRFTPNRSFQNFIIVLTPPAAFTGSGDAFSNINIIDKTVPLGKLFSVYKTLLMILQKRSIIFLFKIKYQFYQGRQLYNLLLI